MRNIEWAVQARNSQLVQTDIEVTLPLDSGLS